MQAVIFPLLAGLGAAMWHVWSGPDHLAAVTPLVLHRRRRFAPVGLAWGAGHTIGMGLIGGLYLLLRNYLPVERISAHAEAVVGVVLIVVGMAAILRGQRQWKRHHVHPHVHADGEEEYIHIHAHRHGPGERHGPGHMHTHVRPRRQTIVAALGIGILHGFAGIAHLVLLLPTLGFSRIGESAAYLGGFLGGAMLAMGMYAVVVGRLAVHFGQRVTRRYGAFQVGSGVLAVAVGIYWLMTA